MNVDALKAEVEAFIREELRDVLSGTEATLKAYAPAIANDLVTAAAAGDTAKVKELAAQAKALGVLKGMHASKAGWNTVRQVVGIAGRWALAALFTAAKGGVG